MSAAPTATAAEVAALLAMDKDDFLRRRPRLQTVHGFPRVLPGCGRRWSRTAVLDWIEARNSASGRRMPERAETQASGRAGGPASGRRTPERAEDQARAEHPSPTLLEQRYAGAVVSFGRRA